MTHRWDLRSSRNQGSVANTWSPARTSVTTARRPFRSGTLWAGLGRGPSPRDLVVWFLGVVTCLMDHPWYWGDGPKRIVQIVQLPLWLLPLIYQRGRSPAR